MLYRYVGNGLRGNFACAWMIRLHQNLLVGQLFSCERRDALTDQCCYMDMDIPVRTQTAPMMQYGTQPTLTISAQVLKLRKGRSTMHGYNE